MTGKQIKALRLRRGWSQTQLAAVLGVNDKGRISKIETGKRKPTAVILAALRLLEQGARI